MHDLRVPGASRRRARAVEEVEAWIASLPGGKRRLNNDELRAYSQLFDSGWRFDVEFGDRSRRLDLLLDAYFPRTAARFALVDRPAYLTWPHIEEDGTLCLLPDDGSVSVSHGRSAVQSLFGRAIELVEECVAGANEQDLRDEFRSYWGRAATPNATPIVSLLRPEGPSREIHSWWGDRFIVVGEDPDGIADWLRNRGPVRGTLRTNSGVLLWVERPPLPIDYPRTAQDVLVFARRVAPESVDYIEQLGVATGEDILVLVVAPTRNGPCLGGITIPAPKLGNPFARSVAKPLSRGFRDGRVPPELLLRRRFGAFKAIRRVVERADASWVHGRDVDVRFSVLRQQRAVVLGCGSVGAPIAVALAEAGVGLIDMVDPESLSFANVGRHPLGAEDVGRKKATALATRLRARFPHTRGITGTPRRWEDLVRDNPKFFESADVIVSAMGNWASEGTLNEWHVSSGRRVPIIYAWTEAHACAGHAVLIGADGGCLQCGLDDHGTPHLTVTEWPSGPTTRTEPGCGSVFQPYGPVELSHVSSMAAELTLEALLMHPRRSTQRVWASPRHFLDACGGKWSSGWLALAGAVPGGVVRERRWEVSARCPECNP